MLFMVADSHYIPRNINPPEESYFLLGPRGTGKSTWLLHEYPKAMRIDLVARGRREAF